MDTVRANAARTSIAPVEPHRCPISFLVDYDGTISLHDVGDMLLARHYDDAAELARKDALYDAGRLGSRELMQWDMDVLPDDPELLRAEAAAVPQDLAFPRLVEMARACGAQVEVVSDGLGFYVRSNLAAIGVADVPVATNDNALSGGGAGMSFPYGHPTCFVCGTCKRERVRLHQAAGRVVVFIGDGTSDRFAAAHADVVFAKTSLARICSELGWPYVPWRSFDDVCLTVKQMLEDGRLPARGDEIDDWRARHGRSPGAFICGPEVWGPGARRPRMSGGTTAAG